MRHLVIKLAVHEACQQQLLWLVQPILKAEFFVAQQRLFLIIFERQNVLLVVDVDVFLDHAHVIRPELHCVTY